MANIIAIRRRRPAEQASDAAMIHALRLPALPAPSPDAELVLAFFRNALPPDQGVGLSVH